MSAAIRIFTYLPNPRVMKATIAGRLAGVEVEVRGAPPGELAGWLWDADARPLTDAERAEAANVRIGTTGFRGTPLRKTEAFLDAHPFGTVPAAFSPDGRVGVFESNAILRAVARLGAERFPLYGRDVWEASRIDSFLDATLVFGRDAQIYLLALLAGEPTPEIHARARDALATQLAGIDRALAPNRRFLVGDDVTIADVAFVAEIALFANERARRAALDAAGLAPLLDAALADPRHARAAAHFERLRRHPAFAPDLEPHLAKLEPRG